MTSIKPIFDSAGRVSNLCSCADDGMHCKNNNGLGELCMARDKWYVKPCREGRCPGPMSQHCCHEQPPDYGDDES